MFALTLRTGSMALATLLLAAFSGCNFNSAPEAVTYELLPDRQLRAKKPDEKTPEQEAILRVMDENRTKLKAGYDTFAANSQPKAVNLMAKNHIQFLEKVNMDGCPPGFKAAVNQYTTAWKQFQTTVAKLADSFEGNEFMTDLMAAFRTNGKTGRALGGDLMAAVQKLNAANDELHKTCTDKFDMELPLAP